jgi:hypothetical protein
LKKEKIESEISDAKKDFLNLIEAYKASNPVKYAAKKAELERKLALL